MSLRGLGVIVAGMFAGVVLAGITLWPEAPVGPLRLIDVLRRLPPGSLVLSSAHLEADGRAPPEMAVLVGIPSYPQSPHYAYYSYIFTSDRRRGIRAWFGEPLPAPLPVRVDAGRLLDDRDAALLVASLEDGTRLYRIVGARRGVARILHEGRVRGHVLLADPLVIEDGEVRRALRWDGAAFRDAPAPPSIVSLPALTWRYGVRHGRIVGASSTVQLRPRQSVWLQRSGGGPIHVIIPDPRLDIVEENVFRARLPGIYTIRIFVAGAAGAQEFPLTIEVLAAPSP